MQDVDAGGLPKEFAGEMLRGAEAGAGEGELAGIGLGGGDQLLDVIGGKIGARHDDQAGGCDLRDRIECGERIVAQRLVHDRGDDLARGHDAERIAVLLGAGDGLVAQRAGGARTVFDHHGLAELLLQRLRDDAADDVGAAAGPERHNHAHAALRPILRARGARAGEHCGGRDGKQTAAREHERRGRTRGVLPSPLWGGVGGRGGAIFRSWGHCHITALCCSRLLSNIRRSNDMTRTIFVAQRPILVNVGVYAAACMASMFGENSLTLQ